MLHFTDSETPENLIRQMHQNYQIHQTLPESQESPETSDSPDSGQLKRGRAYNTDLLSLETCLMMTTLVSGWCVSSLAALNLRPSTNTMSESDNFLTVINRGRVEKPIVALQQLEQAHKARRCDSYLQSETINH